METILDFKLHYDASTHTMSLFGTSHSLTAQRDNVLVCVALNALNAEYCGYGEAGLPPKKPPMYLADFEDVRDFLKGIKIETEGFNGDEDMIIDTDNDETGLKHALKALLRGMDSHPDQSHATFAARACLECAILDCLGKILRKPLYQYLYALPGSHSHGISQNHSRPSFYTAALNPDLELLAESAEFGLRQTPYLKIKLDADIDKSKSVLERLERLCTDVSPDSRWVIDANAAWTPSIAIAMLDVIVSKYKHRVWAVEQPFPFPLYDLDSWIEVKHIYEAAEVFIFADESVRDVHDVKPLQPICHGVNLKLDKAGGHRAVIAAAKEARRLGLFVWIGMMVASKFSAAAASHLLPMAVCGDLDGSLLVSPESQVGMVSSIHWDAESGCIVLPGCGAGCQTQQNEKGHGSFAALLESCTCDRDYSYTSTSNSTASNDEVEEFEGMWGVGVSINLDVLCPSPNTLRRFQIWNGKGKVCPHATEPSLTLYTAPSGSPPPANPPESQSSPQNVSLSTSPATSQAVSYAEMARHGPPLVDVVKSEGRDARPLFSWRVPNPPSPGNSRREASSHSNSNSMRGTSRAERGTTTAGSGNISNRKEKAQAQGRRDKEKEKEKTMSLTINQQSRPHVDTEFESPSRTKSRSKKSKGTSKLGALRQAAQASLDALQKYFEDGNGDSDQIGAILVMLAVKIECLSDIGDVMKAQESFERGDRANTSWTVTRSEVASPPRTGPRRHARTYSGTGSPRRSLTTAMASTPLQQQVNAPSMDDSVTRDRDRDEHIDGDIAMPPQVHRHEQVVAWRQRNSGLRGKLFGSASAEVERSQPVVGDGVGDGDGEVAGIGLTIDVNVNIDTEADIERAEATRTPTQEQVLSGVPSDADKGWGTEGEGEGDVDWSDDEDEDEEMAGVDWADLDELDDLKEQARAACQAVRQHAMQNKLGGNVGSPERRVITSHSTWGDANRKEKHAKAQVRREKLRQQRQEAITAYSRKRAELMEEAREKSAKVKEEQDRRLQEAKERRESHILAVKDNAARENEKINEARLITELTDQTKRAELLQRIEKEEVRVESHQKALSESQQHKIKAQVDKEEQAARRRHELEEEKLARQKEMFDKREARRERAAVLNMSKRGRLNSAASADIDLDDEEDVDPLNASMVSLSSSMGRDREKDSAHVPPSKSKFTALLCELCIVELKTKEAVDEHVASAEHRKAVKDEKKKEKEKEKSKKKVKVKVKGKRSDVHIPEYCVEIELDTSDDVASDSLKSAEKRGVRVGSGSSSHMDFDAVMSGYMECEEPRNEVVASIEKIIDSNVEPVGEVEGDGEGGSKVIGKRLSRLLTDIRGLMNNETESTSFNFNFNNDATMQKLNKIISVALKQEITTKRHTVSDLTADDGPVVVLFKLIVECMGFVSSSDNGDSVHVLELIVSICSLLVSMLDSDVKYMIDVEGNIPRLVSSALIELILVSDARLMLQYVAAMPRFLQRVVNFNLNTAASGTACTSASSKKLNRKSAISVVSLAKVLFAPIIYYDSTCEALHPLYGSLILSYGLVGVTKSAVDRCISLNKGDEGLMSILLTLVALVVRLCKGDTHRVLDAMANTLFCGVVDGLAAVFSLEGASSASASSSQAPSRKEGKDLEEFASVALASLNLMSSVALMSNGECLSQFQGIVMSCKESFLCMIKHLSCEPMINCSPTPSPTHSNSHSTTMTVFNELLLTIGLFVSGNEEGQNMLVSGGTPTFVSVLSQNLPLQHLTVPIHMSAALPTLIAMCYKNELVALKLSRRISLLHLKLYLEKEMKGTKTKPSASSEPYALCNRVPEDSWTEALEYLSEKCKE